MTPSAALARIDSVELVDYFSRVDAPRHPEARKLLDHWCACIGKGDGFVANRDIPAREIANLLRSVALYEPLADNSNFKVRLAGQMVGRRFGGETKGALMSELFSPDDFKHHLSAAREVIHMGQPLVLDSCLTRGGVEELHTEALLLPIESPDRKSVWLLVGMFYFE